MSPLNSDPLACAELECPHLGIDPSDYCAKVRRCGFAWQRKRAEDELKREEAERFEQRQS